MSYKTRQGKKNIFKKATTPKKVYVGSFALVVDGLNYAHCPFCGFNTRISFNTANLLAGGASKLQTCSSGNCHRKYNVTNTNNIVFVDPAPAKTKSEPKKIYLSKETQEEIKRSYLTTEELMSKYEASYQTIMRILRK